MKNLLEKLLRAQSLSPDETREFFEALIGQSPPEMKAALLTALRAKTETVAEILGMAREMRRHAISLPDVLREALDTCGTGGDASHTINISTLSALVLSSMGVPVVKHGNRSVSSSCGSADLLEGLGFPLDLSPEDTVTLFQKTRFTFLFAPLYHPAMKSVAPIRKALQIRTIFNFLGPLSNPAKVFYQVVGVPKADLVRPFAEVLRGLGLKSAMVVHGENGMDEISPCGKTGYACFLSGGAILEGVLTPEGLGLKSIRLEELVVSNVQEAVRRARSFLDGNPEEPDIIAVTLSAAAGLWMFGKAANFLDGVAQVKNYLSAGRLRSHVEEILNTAKKLKSHAD